jgi:hypothetical protein
MSKKLTEAMEKAEEVYLRQVIKEIDPCPKIINSFQTWEGDIDEVEDIDYVKTHIDEKLLNQAHILLEKLRTQNILKVFIKNLDLIPDYKTILKSRNVIDLKLQDAATRHVQIDRVVKDMARGCKDRIIAERNLRFKLDDYTVQNATNAQVDDLTKYLNLAREAKVAENYCSEAEDLRTKMDESITVNDIFKEFQGYPVRFPEDNPELKYPKRFVYYDHTGDKKFHNLFRARQVFDKKQLPKFGIDADLQKKLMEPPKPSKKKKKKKKKLKPGQFDEDTIPEEFKEEEGLQHLEKRITQIEELIAKAEDLCLSEEYLKLVDVELQRIKKELNWRKMFEKNNNLFYDALDAKKGKGKK